MVCIEIPKERRFCLDNIIIAGLSGALVKPEFEIFLAPIMQEMKMLELGMLFVIERRVTKSLRFFLFYGIFDKPARASFLNIISSNGYYGCLKCLQP